MEHKTTPTIFEQFAIFMERDTRAVQVVTYGIASVGLLVALYRIRPFTKFSKPSNIPSHFLERKISLKGTVKQIEPSGGILMVQHKPLLPLPFLNSKKYLPVKIAGVNITSNGVQWLQFITNGKEVTFIPLNKRPEYVNCIVTMSQKNQESLQVGETLVKLGFGTLHELPSTLLKDKDTLTYWKTLVKAQKWAEWYRKGYWQFVKHPTLLWKIQMICSEKVRSLLPKFMTKYVNI